MRRPAPGPRRAAALAAAALFLAAACPAEVFDGFDGEAVDAARWKPVPAGARHQVVAPTPEHASRAAAIWIEPDDVETDVAKLLAEEPRRDCLPELPALPIQRSELRLRDETGFGEARWYGFRFRIDGEWETIGSTRFVIGQWKQSESCWSPFLAQRFDNGVFHVTVEDEECRATIAKAAGDPEALGWPRLAGDDESRYFATDAAGDLRGVAVEWSANPGVRCTARIRLDPPLPPELPSAAGRWVSMAYLVRGGFDGSARIEVWAEGKPIVAVTGHIGEGQAGRREQFKFGLYRNQMKLRTTMTFDSFRRGATREAVDPTLCGD